MGPFNVDAMGLLILPERAVRFGCSNTLSGVSTSRTFMSKEMSLLLDATLPQASIDIYRQAIVDENVLNKASMQTRGKTFRFLRDRYGLDLSIPLFRCLRVLCDAEPGSRPQLAMLAAVARDPLLRSTVPVVLDTPVGSPLGSADLARAMSSAFPSQFTEKTLASSSENAMATWIQSGLFRKGQRQHLRQAVAASPASTTLSLLLGEVSGAIGAALLTTPWTALIGGTPEVLLSHARDASLHDWLELRNAGGVVEVTFRHLAPELDTP